MTSAAKQNKPKNHYEKTIKDLFRRYSLPITLPEYQEILEQGEQASRANLGSFVTMERIFENEIKALVEKVKTQEAENRKSKVNAEKVKEYANTPNLPLSSYRNHGPFMALPFFSTSRQVNTKSYEFTCIDEKGNQRFLKVSPQEDYGQPDQRDADVLRYVLSKIGELVLRFDNLTNTVTLTRAEILKALGKHHGKEDYKWLKTALDRLSSTHYKTNTLHSNAESGFSGTLLAYVFHGKESEGESKVVVTITPPFYDALAIRGAFLQIDETVIKEPSSLRKALLELIKKGMGDKERWEIGSEKLRERVRAVSSKREFRRQLKDRLKLPYSITFRKGKLGDEIVTFTSEN